MINVIYNYIIVFFSLDFRSPNCDKSYRHYQEEVSLIHVACLALAKPLQSCKNNVSKIGKRIP